MTKEKFYSAYRKYVCDNYKWSVDSAKLDGLMASVQTTMTSERTPWVWDGPGSKAAWKAIGCKGKMTLKALRAMS